MRRGQDIAVRFSGLYLVHHNIPGKTVEWRAWPQHMLFIPLQGEITILLRSGSLVSGPGKMIYLPPKTSLAFQSSEASIVSERMSSTRSHSEELTRPSINFSGTIVTLSSVLYYRVFCRQIHSNDAIGRISNIPQGETRHTECDRAIESVEHSNGEVTYLNKWDAHDPDPISHFRFGVFCRLNPSSVSCL